MRNERACPGCGAADGASAGSKDGHNLRRCRRCASLFVSPLPAPDAREDYAAYYDDGNLEVPAFVHRLHDELVAQLERYRRTNRWLDIGCGAGSLMEAAVRARWDVHGTEVASVPLRRLTARGLKMFEGDLLELSLPSSAYDVVTLVEVLEHLPNPRGVLARIGEVLRPGGVIHLTTPHAHGLSARLLGLHWSVVSPPEHLQLLSVNGLRAAVVDAGLIELEAHTHAVNPYELLGALRRRRSGRATRAQDRVQTGYRLNRALTSRRAGVWLKRGMNGVLDVTRLGDSIKYRAVRPTR
jgi:SAM-dependent methyltransferase